MQVVRDCLRIESSPFYALLFSYPLLLYHCYFPILLPYSGTPNPASLHFRLPENICELHMAVRELWCIVRERKWAS